MKKELKELKRKTRIKLGISGFLMGILLGVFHGLSTLMGILFLTLIFADIIYIEYISRSEGFEACKIIMNTFNSLEFYLSRPVEVTDTDDENKKIFIYNWWGPDESELDIINNYGIAFIYNNELYSTINADEFVLADEGKIRVLAKKVKLYKKENITG